MIENIPDGWKILPLKKLLNIQSGFAFDSKKFSKDKGKQLIRIRDLKNAYTTDVLFNGDYNNNYLVKSGNYLIGMDGDFICYQWKGIDSLLNQRVCRLQDFDSSIDKKFIYYGINKKLKKIHDVTPFVTVKHLSIKKINDIEFLIPPLPQQEKIVKVLDISSQLIEKQKELIVEYDLFLKSKFIEMFGDPIKNPMEWEVVKLGKYGTLARGKSAHRPRNAPFLYGGKYPFIQTGDITKGNSIYLKHYKQTYSEDGIKQSRVFLKDTIAITIAANIGDTKILSFDCYFPDSVVGFNVENPLFVSSLFSYYKIQLEQRATKTAQKNINLQILNNLDVLYLPTDLQNKFAKIVEKIETIKTKESKKLEHLETLHKSLMDKAFKGEII
ncbi:MAG: hypothetical protein GQ570_15015 [Helicobacteraceae bacterium]|nr:hypothetical protein [Helicobacteraceae bacterium]